MIIVTGCAHPGIVNIVDIVKKHFSGGKVDFILGGFHLKNNASVMNLSIIKDLQGFGVRRVAPMHCTGKRATEMMRKAFGSDFVRVREGDSIEL